MNSENDVHGRYLYCILSSTVNSDEAPGFCSTGIDDNPVYMIMYKDIAALVHSCAAKPYETQDRTKAAEWIVSHNYVIDQAIRKFGTVLPCSFDTIVMGSDEIVSSWLEKSYAALREELDRLKNMSEYSIQIFCEHECIKANVDAKPELQKLRERAGKMNKGADYLFTRRFEIKQKDAVHDEISRLSDEFIMNIKGHVEEMRSEKNMHVPEKYHGKKPIVGLTCLVRENRVKKLGEVLDEINKREGFAVRFTGPWAPYSFVHRIDGPAACPVEKREGVDGVS